MSGPASLFLFAASAFAPSCLLAVPVPYMASGKMFEMAKYFDMYVQIRHV